jgi:hypothetical protein
MYVQHRHTKHIELDIHFEREKVTLGALRVLHVPSTSQFVEYSLRGVITIVSRVSIQS